MSKKTPSILIVDDEPDLREILEDRFQVFEFQTATAESGNQAWATLQKQSFDIVLSDIRMANGTGLELLAKIKQANVHKPSVFLMTGFHQDFTERDMLNLGADGFLAKPFDASQIRNSIQKAIVPPQDRWSSQGRYSATKTLAYNVQSKGSDMKVGRLGFSVRTKANDCGIGEILSFELSGSISLKGLGKLMWQHFDQSVASVGIEILYLEPSCLQTYMGWLSQDKPQASIPIL